MVYVSTKLKNMSREERANLDRMLARLQKICDLERRVMVESDELLLRCKEMGATDGMLQLAMRIDRSAVNRRVWKLKNGKVRQRKHI